MPPEEQTMMPDPIQIHDPETPTKHKKHLLGKLFHGETKLHGLLSPTQDSHQASDVDGNDDSQSSQSGDSSTSKNPVARLGRLKSLLHSHHNKSHDNAPRLEEKYEYIKPTQDKSDMGGNKENEASGTTAVLQRVKDRESGHMYAVKKFPKKKLFGKLFETENDYLQPLEDEFRISTLVRGHKNVVDTIDHVLDKRGNWCMVMEYCSKGDLFHIMWSTKLSKLNVDSLFKQLLLGLQHIHSLGVAHRDIKPENLVLTDEGILKICDFGIAGQGKLDSQGKLYWQNWCGSECFWSPEIWNIDGPDYHYDAQALDVWSAAITYYILRYRAPPFDDAFYHADCHKNSSAQSGSPAAISATKKGDMLFRSYIEQRRHGDPLTADIWDGLGEENTVPLADNERECLAGMLDPDPKTRWTIDQVLACDWIKNVSTCLDGTAQEHTP